MAVFKSLQCGKPLVIDYRLRKPDHCYSYCLGVLKPLIDSFEEVFGMFERVLSFHHRAARHQAALNSGYET